MKYLGKIQEAKDLVNVQYVTETVQNAINALDKSDSAVDGQFVTAVSQENGTISATKSQLKASDIPTLEISKINGLQSALNTNSQAISTETSRAEAAEAELLGTSADGEDATTIYGARKLASIAQNLAQNAQASIGNMDLPEVSASTGEVIGVISQTDGKVNATVKTLQVNDIPEIPQSKVTNLTTTLAGKQDTLVFQNNNYDPDTNKAVTNSDLQAALGGSDAISAAIVVDCSTWTGNSFTVTNSFFNNISDSDVVVVSPAPEDLVFAAEYGIYVQSISNGQATLYRTNTGAWQASNLTLNFLVIKGG